MTETVPAFSSLPLTCIHVFENEQSAEMYENVSLTRNSQSSSEKIPAEDYSNLPTEIKPPILGCLDL